MNQVLVYDHTDDAGPLFAMACTLKLTLLRTANQQVAVSSLLASNADTLLVHVDDGPWLELVQDSDRVAKKTVFRFSTHGFPPTHPCGPKQNCFHVNPPTSGAGKISEIQLEDLIRVVNQAGVVDLLRNGTVPSVLRPLIQFEQPHLASALHIVFQARLAEWARDPGHRLQDEARSLLGFDSQVVAPISKIDWPGTLRKVICHGIAWAGFEPTGSCQNLTDKAIDIMRQEFGREACSCEPPIKQVGDALSKVFSPLPPSSDLKDVNNYEDDLFGLLKESFQELGKSLGVTQRDAE